MLSLLESAVRGGVSMCSNRYAKANNKYMETGYDSSKKEDKFIMYLDINNMYGSGMLNPLPCGGFQFLKPEAMKEKFWEVDADSSIGYFIEADISYPRELHDAHSDLPFLPEHRDGKLMTTLYDKKKYVLHHDMLKLVLQHGLKLGKIYRVLRFVQEPFLRDYVLLNIRMRENAKNKFEEMFAKLMVNSIYGKLKQKKLI